MLNMNLLYFVTLLTCIKLLNNYIYTFFNYLVEPFRGYTIISLISQTHSPQSSSLSLWKPENSQSLPQHFQHDDVIQDQYLHRIVQRVEKNRNLVMGKM